MLFGKPKDGGGSIEDQFCRACRAAKRDKDCGSCSRKVETKK
jgi:hypothetical protein